ncbi:hypothetical protein [Trueperella sp. LYQ143]|uniref:hypothetical protein n=1 Tax=Trueperella sp. LYQ143 TaxID=3391059 RepID=UPI0039836127
MALWFATVLIVVLCFASPHWRLNKAAERAPNYLADASTADMAFISGATTIDDTVVPYFIIEPLNGQLRVPGFGKTLGPGEVVISPRLQANESLVTAQFGKIVGVLSTDILLHDEEALVYARPADGQLLRDRANSGVGVEYGAGFGPDARFRNGEVVYDSWSQLLPGLACVTLIPPLLLLTMAALSISHIAMYRKSQIFQIAGARYRQLCRLNLRELGTSFLLGILIGVLFQVLFIAFDVPLPVDFIARSEAIRPYLSALFGADILTGITLVVLFFRPQIGITIKSSRRKIVWWRSSVWLGSFVVGFLVTIMVAIFYQAIPDSTALILLLMGSAMMTAGFPMALSYLVKFYFSRQAREKAPLTFDRLQWQWVSRNSWFATRSGSITGVMLIVGIFISGLYVVSSDSPWGKNYGETRGRIAQVNIDCEMRPECFTELFSSLTQVMPDSFVGATFYGENTDGVLGTARVERGRNNLDIELEHSVNSYVPDSIPEGIGPEESNLVTFYVADSNGVDLTQIAPIRLKSVAHYPTVEWVGAGDKAAADIYNYHSRWVLIFFTIATLLFLNVTLVSQALQARKYAIEISAIVALSGAKDMISHTLSKQHVRIAMISSIFALLIGVYLSYSYVRVSPFELPLGFIAALLAMLILASFVQFIHISRAIAAETVRWLPGKES